MKHKLYINLNENEHKVLCKAKEKTCSKSYRETILAVCNSELVKSLSYIILSEKELRKISVNFHQILRKLEEEDVSCDNLYTVGNILESTIDEVSKEVSTFHVLDFIRDPERKEVAIRMTTEEKETLYAIKKILRFKNYRTMILSLCGFTSYQIVMPDISLKYSELQEAGLVMNKVAKDLNSGYGINNETFSPFIRNFTKLLINISKELSGGKEVVA